MLPDSITVYFEGGIGHTFSNLEWYAYYDESTGIGYGTNRSGVSIVEKQPNGTYLVVIPFDFVTYTGEPIAYASLSDIMRAQQVSVYDEEHGTASTEYLYSNINGYAYVRVSYDYESYYATYYRYGLLPMSSENFSLLVADMSVYYSDTGNNLALTEEQKNITVITEDGSKKLYADTDRDGYAEKLVANIYHDTL